MLLALGIFVAAAAILTKLLVMGMDQSAYVRQQALAIDIAESRVAELDAGLITPANAGTYAAPESAEFQWTLSSSATGQTNLYLVTIEVRRIENHRGQPIKFSRHWFDSIQAQTDADNRKQQQQQASSGSSSAGSTGSAGGQPGATGS